MDTLLPFSAENLDSMVDNAVDRFFDTMLPGSIVSFQEAVTLKPGSRGPNKEPSDDPMIVSMVGFIGGINGVLYLYMRDQLARDITCQFLGLEPDELAQEPEETVNDALGEMANMIAGTFKNGLCDSGYNCRLTIPSILRGKQFSVETTSGVMRRVFRFNALGDRLTCDLLMKPVDQ